MEVYKKQAHEYASIFPMATDDELREMANDIEKRGQLNAIITLDGKVLDGRNRLRACEMVNAVPHFVEYTGIDPLGDVLSWNLHRRQLTSSQRAIVATKLATMKQGARNDLEPYANLRNVSQEQASKSLGVSTRLVQQAKVIERESPELAKEVEAGRITISAAHEQIKAKAQEKEEEKYTEPKKQKTGKGIEIACEAIKVLRGITANDPLRDAGFKMVTKWIKDNK